MFSFAPRMGLLKSSATLDISAAAQELKNQGLDVVGLAAGEPDFPTPEPIRKAAEKAIEEGITRYTPSLGFLTAREAVAKKVSRENGFEVEASEVILTSGAKQAIYMALQCLVGPGDAVLLPTPAWVSYGPMIELTGASVIPLPLFEDDGFQPNVDRWKGLAPPNAKGIIFNSPNNPTGVCYSGETLKRVAAWALQRNLWIMSDEIYDKLVFEGSHTSFSALGPEVKSHTITIGGPSKTYCMTGWRLGWAIASDDLIKKMGMLQSQVTSHPTSFVQWTAITAAGMGNETLDKMVKAFDERRHFCMGRLDSMKNLGVSYVRLTGAFYFFINISDWLTSHRMSDTEFCKELLSKALVGTVPGSAFGLKDHFRISYATSLKNLEKGLERIEKFLE